LFITTRATVQGRAVFGLRRDAPAFSGERGRFTRLNDEGSGRLRPMAASICRRQPDSARPDGFAPDIMAPYMHYPRAILLYKIPHVVIGENRTFQGPEDYLRSRGVELEIVDDSECFELMQAFILNNDTLWNEDIGE
jgi:hypothetical protein